MTVKIKNEELFKKYKVYINLSYDGEWTLTHTIQSFLIGVVASSLDTDHDDEISTIIKAIIDGEPVELVEPKYFCYLEIPHCGGSDALQISFQGNGYACTFINLGDFYTYNDCQFTQSEVDELKADYPYIQTKEVEE